MKTIDAIKLSLSAHRAEFARGRALTPALTPFEAPDHVLQALAFSATTSAPERDAITLALIVRHQSGRHPLWQSLLLVAYEPMLAGVWKRLINKRDAEARLVLALLEAIAAVNIDAPPSLLALHLRQAVERRAFGSTAEAHQEPDFVPLNEARKEPAPGTTQARVEAGDEMRRVVAELTTLLGDEAAEVLDVLIRARTGRPALAALIEEMHADQSSRARAAIFHRLERQRRVALAHLEAVFGSERLSSALLAA